ncbi:hypothetical protein F5888DRAFT_1633508 [Russula emetica]|nr:hypothetical protein F5888DRAFT_1633508 [Russula emetica]
MILGTTGSDQAIYGERLIAAPAPPPVLRVNVDDTNIESLYEDYPFNWAINFSLFKLRYKRPSRKGVARLNIQKPRQNTITCKGASLGRIRVGLAQLRPHASAAMLGRGRKSCTEPEEWQLMPVVHAYGCTKALYAPQKFLRPRTCAAHSGGQGSVTLL